MECNPSSSSTAPVGGYGTHRVSPPGGRRRQSKGGMNLLKNYYEVEGAREVDERKEAAEAVSSMRDLFEKPGFDPKAYAHELLNSTNADDVVAHQTSMEGMSQALLAENAALVEQNFTKLTEASQVAGKISSTFGHHLSDEKNQLARILNYIGGSSLRLHDELGVTSNKLMKKLKRKQALDAFVRLRGLSSLIRRCVSESRYHDALKAYRKGCELTRACGKIPEPPDGCLDVLWHRFRQEKHWDSSIALAKTLIEFGADGDEVLNRYLTNATNRAEQFFDIVFQSFANTKVSTDSFESKYRNVCGRIVSHLIPFLISVIETCCEFDARQNDVVKEQPLHEFVSKQVQLLCNRFLSDVFLTTPHPPPSVQTLVGGVLRIRDALRPLYAMFSKLLSRIFMRFLHMIAKNAARILFEASSVNFLETVFEAYQTLAENDEDVGFVQMVEKIEHEAILIVSVALADCEPLLNLIANDKNGKITFVELVYDYVVGFFKKFQCAVGSYVSRGLTCAVTTETQKTGVVNDVIKKFENLVFNNLFVLSLVRMALHFQSGGVLKLAEVSSDLMPDSCHFPAKKVSEHCGCAGNAALSYYVQVVGSKFLILLQNHLQSRNWLADNQPIEPSVVIPLLIQELQIIAAEIGKFVEDAPRRAVRTRRGSVGEMDRLVARKEPIFDDVVPTQSGVLSGILRVFLKGFIESVRQEFFSQGGILQIRLDIGLLQQEIALLVDDSAHFDGFYEEVLASAQRRCVSSHVVTAGAAAVLTQFAQSRNSF